MDCSVLIVDDMKSACAALGAILRDNGISDIDLCFDGESALQRIVHAKQEYDAVFIDLHFQGMDGLELIHKLNNIAYPGAIIIISALEEKIVELALEVVSDYNVRVLGALSKPFQNACVTFIVKRIQALKERDTVEEVPLSRREFFSALKSQSISCHYQPKIAYSDKRIVGLECLLRMEVPQLGRLSAMQVISAAERYDFMEALTDAVLNVALPEFMQFRQQCEHCHLALNLSPLQLCNPLLPESLIEYLSYYAIKREDIMLEITEHHALKDPLQLKNINRLRINGFALSLDDFGKGHTNLRQLKKLPFNELKFDARCISGIRYDKSVVAMLESIKALADEMGLTYVAEGIENYKDLECLLELGLDVYQGYLFCRPKPMDELLRWYRSWDKTIQQVSKSPEAAPIQVQKQ